MRGLEATRLAPASAPRPSPPSQPLPRPLRRPHSLAPHSLAAWTPRSLLSSLRCCWAAAVCAPSTRRATTATPARATTAPTRGTACVLCQAWAAQDSALTSSPPALGHPLARLLAAAELWLLRRQPQECLWCVCRASARHAADFARVPVTNADCPCVSDKPCSSQCSHCLHPTAAAASSSAPTPRAASTSAGAPRSAPSPSASSTAARTTAAAGARASRVRATVSSCEGREARSLRGKTADAVVLRWGRGVPGGCLAALAHGLRSLSLRPCATSTTTARGTVTPVPATTAVAVRIALVPPQ